MYEGKIAITSLSDEEKDLFLSYLYNNKDFECIDYLESILGDRFMEFLDLFEGETIKIPTRKTTLGVITNISIYNYIKERNFEPQAFENASRLFKKRVPAIQRIVEKVDNIVNGNEAQSLKL